MNLIEAAQMALEALQESKPIDIDDPTAFYRSAHAIEALRAALAQPEQEPVGNTLTFMTRAIFNIVADHQEINGGYFIADGDVAAFVDRLAKVINSTFEPLKHKNPAPPQREWCQCKDAPNDCTHEKNCRVPQIDAAFKRIEWQGLTDEEIDEAHETTMSFYGFARAIEAKLKEKNT